MNTSPTQTLYLILCAIFVTALVIADIIGGKLILLGPFSLGSWHVDPLVLSAGIIPFPITFVLTDLINEFYGKAGAKRITFVGLGMAVFAALILYIARLIPAPENSPISQESFNAVFGLSNRMFLASLCAYLLGQLLDINVFHALRALTKERFLWLRATGSTVISQLIDSLVVVFIAFAGTLPLEQITAVAINNYGVKFLVAVALTPLCYLGHAVIYRLLASPVASESPHTASAS